MTSTQLLKNAKSSCSTFNNIDTETKNKVLVSMAECLVENTNLIIEANKKDIEYAKDKIDNFLIKGF